MHKLIKSVLQVKKRQAKTHQRRQQRLKTLLGRENLGLSSESELMMIEEDLAAEDDDLAMSDEMSSSLSSDLSADKSDSSIAVPALGDMGLDSSEDSDVSNLPASLSSVCGLDSSVLMEESGSESELSDDSGMDADDESESDDAGFIDDLSMPQPPHLHRFACRFIQNLYSHRYLMPRNQLPRGPSQLRHVVDVLKVQRPDRFRECLRVSPFTFDKICEKICLDPVFSNQSQNDQIPVQDQLAVALFRFGHDGNGASMQVVADWAGLGKGTVHLVTRRVMTAILRPSFRCAAVCLPTSEEKEQAKAWVESHSCPAWRNGWCLVDGTLIPLYDRPHWYGESYFDRKSNYSLNIQVSFLPTFMTLY